MKKTKQKPEEKPVKKERAIELAVDQIEKQFGKGSIMRLGSEEAMIPIDSISTGSLALDIALGIGGVPRGRIIEIFGPEGSGKTTLFNAATLLNAEISNYPFTTKEPNMGTAYVCDTCVCKELGMKDNPLNSACIEGWRYVPVKLIDVPGLVKDAWMGRGLGNRFLSVIGQADALIHVVTPPAQSTPRETFANRGAVTPCWTRLISRWRSIGGLRGSSRVTSRLSFVRHRLHP